MTYISKDGAAERRGLNKPEGQEIVLVVVKKKYPAE